MKITKERIQATAKNLLAVLDEQRIISLSDLETRAEETFPISPGEYVQFSLRPSNHKTYAHTISYIIEGAGIPIEARINSALGYSAILLKTTSILDSYNAFSIDTYNNFLQNKLLRTTNLETVRKEIENLTHPQKTKPLFAVF